MDKTFQKGIMSELYRVSVLAPFYSPLSKVPFEHGASSLTSGVLWSRKSGSFQKFGVVF